MASFPPPPPPPGCANCMTTTQPAAGGPPSQSPSSMVRSSDGKMRIDMPNTTVITNPAAQQAIVLNHLTKEAQVLPLQPQPSGAPQLPMPQVGAAPPAAPKMASVSVQDLGKAFIEGHPVEGQRYVVQPPPSAPSPKAPQMPPVPAAPTISEVWTSSQLKMPVLTKVTTPAGVQTTVCKPTATAEPNPAAFQIPAGYSVIMPKKS